MDLRWPSLITTLSSDHQVYFLMNILGKPFFTQERSQKGEKCGFVYAQLDDYVHKQTIICRQLFAGHMVGFGPMKK